LAGPPSNVVVCHLKLMLNCCFTFLVKSFVARFQSAAWGAKTSSVTAGFPVTVGNGLLSSAVVPDPLHAATPSASTQSPATAADLVLLS
jgi:hypothetical protein